MKSSLAILTFNEIEGVKTLFNKIPFNEFDEYFVIDLHSTDGTVEYFKERGVRVIFQEKKGRGEAFRIASRIATGDILVFFSPDGNENPTDTIKLKEIIEQGCDMAIASRFLPEAQNEQSSSFFPYRAWGNQVFTFLANLLFGGNLTDAINGFRAIKKDKFQELKIDAEGFAVEYQMSIRAKKLNQKIQEVPTIEGQRIGGKSTAKAIPTGLRILKVLLREIWLGEDF